MSEKAVSNDLEALNFGKKIIQSNNYEIYQFSKPRVLETYFALQSVTKYVDRLGLDCNKSPQPPCSMLLDENLAVQLLSFVLYCLPDHSLRTYGNIEMGQGGLKVIFAIS